MAQTALWLSYGGVLVVFLWVCAQFYVPGKGFTYLIMFGDRDAAQFLPELRALNYYQIPDSVGYDASNYAQIAMHPQLGDAVLRDAVDSLPYRARRILFCWTAYALALGNPEWALHIYAFQNIACWFALAVLLWRWFPATSWDNFVRWAGVLFSFGLCFSVRGSLVDGPSLLLIAGAVALAERGRPGWSALLMGVSGLGKETNVLAGAALAPARATRRDWLRAIGCGAVVMLPLALWLVGLKLWLGESMEAGYRNFALPFAGYVGKWREFTAGITAHGWGWAERGSVLVIVALTVQFLFVVLRPRWRDAWWRVGAAYAVLMAVLGEAVWEGYPGAASRVLLPLGLAFNVLVPRGLRWWPVLLLGNITVLLAPDALQPPARESYRVDGPRALRIAAAGQTVSATFDAQWHGPERTRFEFWRWSRGSAEVTLQNPHAFPITVDLSFELRVHGDRTIVIQQGGHERWSGVLKSGTSQRVRLTGVPLAPGANVFGFETDAPGTVPTNGDTRVLAFSLRNLRIDVTDRAVEQ